MRVALVDPSAFTPPYDQALAAALSAAGQDVDLMTSRFAYGAVTSAGGHRTHEFFYRHARGEPGSRLRQALKLAEHVPDMLRLRRATAGADVVHFQWLTLPGLDRHLLPEAPTVLTAHDLLPREPRPGQLRAQRRVLAGVDAVIVHSRYGHRQLVEVLGLPEAKVHVVRHGAFTQLAALPQQALPAELSDDGSRVVLFFGLLRPYKGIENLLDAWPAAEPAQLWVVGHPRMSLGPLRARARGRVSFVPRYVSDGELAACFRRADLLVLPYTRTERFDQSGVLATALGFGKPVIASDIGGFSEVAATGAVALTPPEDTGALRAQLERLIRDADARDEMAAAAQAAADGAFSWAQSARDTIEVYESVIR